MITHDPSNPNALVDWTQEINDIDNQFGFIRENIPFNNQVTSQTSIVFDKNTNTISLVPSKARRAKGGNRGKDNAVEQFSAILQYYPYDDYIDSDDIQDKRAPGNPDTAETFDSVRAEKLVNLKLGQDQTDEYLRFKAMKGDLPAGAVAGVSDMYGLFGLNVANFTVDLESDNDATDLDGKISQVKRLVASGVKSGTRSNGVDFILDYALFDEIKAHVQFREDYQYFASSGSQVLRDDLSSYYDWGITDMFEHAGVRFMAYNPEFEQEDGTSVQVLGAGQGIAIPRNATDMFRGYWGPSTKIALANTGGQEMFAFEYESLDGEGYTLETQSTKLYLATKPSAIIQLT